MPKRADSPQQQPLFDPFEMVRLDLPPVPTPTGPKPDPTQLTLTTEGPNDDK